MPSGHVPVLLEETLSALSCRSGKLYLDATVGAGGHAFEILRRSSPHGRLIGADQDPAALERARQRLSPYSGRFELIHENFRRLPTLLSARGESPFDGILLDLGVSSDQLADPGRGFSFSQGGPLDMRMDVRSETTAASLVKLLDAGALRRIFREHGEDPDAAAIARAIVRERERAPIDTTDRLAAIIASAVPPARRHARIHPATRAFQALRIAVNEELDALSEALEVYPDLLAPGGRLAIISFHSLEDRIVKRRFRALEGRCTCPPKLPVCRCGASAQMRVLSRRAVRPSAAEVAANPRARSARLRAAERLGEAA
ncbi:MAG: 16S rRNA (cytosine(1402)-N(4))-methyltransferase RsmH [Deltaproteobacteria bacterium]|nr:16S rRNA (cytosine(1402)-N(4))-methyltransferase RsmH [Deltaproteobacteria bacterium]